MAPPSTILDLRAELQLGGTWTDISHYVYQNKDVAGIVITRGHPDESTVTNPTSGALTLKNVDGRFSSRNPLGPYYPNLVRNTPVRVSVPEGASYLRADFDQASYGYCNDSAGISVTGDTEIQLDVTLSNWRGQQALAGKWFSPMAQRSWRLVLNDGGTLTFRWSSDGVTNSAAISTVPVPVPPLGRLAIKVTLAVASGTVTFYTAPAAVSQAPLGSILNNSPVWTQLGSAVVVGAANVFDSTAGLYVSGFNQIGWYGSGGDVHSCYLIDPVTVKAFYDTPDALISGSNPLVNPVQDGLAATPILTYKIYAQAVADMTNLAFTQNSVTYTPNGPIGAFYKWVQYDIEGGAGWPTPIEEKQDPQTYIGNFIALAHAHGFKCMVDPARDLSGTDTAHPAQAGETSEQWYIRTNMAAACATADLYEIQAQGDQGSPQLFAAFYNTAKAQAQAVVSTVPVWCGISTQRPGPAGTTIAQAMYNSAVSVAADGYWINIVGDAADALAFMKLWLPNPEVPFIAQMQGKTHALKLLSGIGGTVVASPDFTAATAGASTVTDAQGNVFKLYANTEISNRKYRMHGEGTSWPQAWDPSGNESWTSVTAAGLLRRLNQGSSQLPVTSAMTRYWTKLTGAAAPVAYWSCENAARGRQITSTLPGGPSIGFTAGHPSMAADTNFIASAPLPVLNFSVWSGAVPGYNGTDAVINVLVDVPSGGDNNGVELCHFKLDGSISDIALSYTPTPGTLTASASDSAGTFTQNLFTTGQVDGQQLAVRIWLAALTSSLGSPMQVQFGMQVMPPGGSVSTQTSPVACTNIGQIRSFTVDNGSTGAKGTGLGHIAIQSYYQDLSSLSGPLSAYAAEPAGIRFQRLCGEEGIPFRGAGQLSQTVVMDTQLPDTVMNLLQACANTDRGVIFEPRQALALGYAASSTLRNQPAAVALNYAAAHLAGSLTPADDDQTIVNDITVSRQSAGMARLVLGSGALSVQPPPNGVGRYAAAVTLSVPSDPGCRQEAGWLLHMGTVNENRYPLLQLDLARTAVAGLYYDLQDADLGRLVTVSNPPVWLPPDGIAQLIQQTTERLGGYIFQIDWTGVPASPWLTALANIAHADTDGCTLAAGVNSTVTQIGAVAGTNLNGGTNALWTTAQADFPFDVKMGGERMTVTDIGGPGLNFLTGDNAAFDTSLGTWTGAGNSALARVTSPVHSGAGAMQITSSAAGDATAAHCNAGNILTQGMPCSPNDVIYCAAWFRTAVSARSCVAGATFYTSGGVVISTLLAPGITDATSGYTKVAGTVIAPATAAFCRLIVRVQATGAASEVHDVDDVYLTDVTTGSAASQTMTVTRSVNGIVKSHTAGEAIALFTPAYAPLAQ